MQHVLIEAEVAMRSITLAAIFFMTGACLHAQQIPDTVFAVPNEHPMYESGTGPVVCIDAAHHNFHTLEGRYHAFGRLVRGDGFQTRSLEQSSDEFTLENCDVVVVAGALAAQNAVVEGDPEATRSLWDYPHPPAFEPAEVRALIKWLHEGGALLLIMDHAPFPGAVSDLAALVGVVPLNGGAMYRLFGEPDPDAIGTVAQEVGYSPEQLRRALGEPGGLGDHPILRGREGIDRPVRSIMTFGGTAFLPSEGVQPLLILPTEAFGLVSTPDISQELWPRYRMADWVAGGAVETGQGRAVVLGEAAMCTAQLQGVDGSPMGMNHPLAGSNPQFCLNVVRWLARAF
jgi:hypothetical protein